MTTIATTDLDTLFKHLEEFDDDAFATTTDWRLSVSEGPFVQPLTMKVGGRQDAIEKLMDLRRSIHGEFTVSVEVLVRMRADMPNFKEEENAL